MFVDKFHKHCFMKTVKKKNHPYPKHNLKNFVASVSYK